MPSHLRHIPLTCDYAKSFVPQRTEEERDAITRVGQLDEVISVKDMANKDLRLEVKVLQAALTKMEMQVQAQEGELRAKSLAVERAKNEHQDDQETIAGLKERVVHLADALAKAENSVHAARKDALDR